MLLPTLHSAGDDPAAPSVVLVHGFLSSARADFADTGWLPALSARNRRAMAVELPAHGAPDTADLSPTAIAAAIARTIAHFYAGEPVDVVGYSLGARLAWELPHAGVPVRRLVLGGLSLADPFAGLDAAALARAVDGEAADGLTGMIAGMIRGSGGDVRALTALVAGLGSEPFDAAARVPALPTLLAAGAEDPMARGLDELARALPDAAYVRVPGDHVGALASAELRDAALRHLA